jgi:hypothetical protein
MLRCNRKLRANRIAALVGEVTQIVRAALFCPHDLRGGRAR